MRIRAGEVEIVGRELGSGRFVALSNTSGPAVGRCPLHCAVYLVYFLGDRHYREGTPLLRPSTASTWLVIASVLCSVMALRREANPLCLGGRW